MFPNRKPQSLGIDVYDLRDYISANTDEPRRSLGDRTYLWTCLPRNRRAVEGFEEQGGRERLQGVAVFICHASVAAVSTIAAIW
jgi:hypothetical protein